ncbi:MAG: hypothetical protein JNK32_10995 [Anaerolineales bacterium]|nr:hypothetical protein [Anaerolineales bacterium]
MKYFQSIIFLLAFFIAACAPNNPEQPVSNEDPQTPPQTGDYIPSPADGGLTRGEVFLDSTDLLTLESYPLQFNLTLKGNLPTPCHQLRIAVNPPDTENKIVVDVYSLVNPGEVCIQVLDPFEVNYPLGSFPQGTYSLWINGEMVAEFEA